MKRKLVWTTAAALVGMYIGTQNAFLLACGVACIPLLCGTLLLFFTKRFVFLFALGLLVLCAFFYSAARVTCFSRGLDAYDRKKVAVHGTVCAVTQVNNGVRLTVRDALPDLPHKKILLTLTNTKNAYTYGDEIETFATLYLPARAANVGGTDVRLIYMARGVSFSAYAADATTVGHTERGIGAWLYRARRYVQANIATYLTGDERGLATALVTGDKQYMSDAQIADFRNAGISHIVAVSGMHLSMLVSVMMGFSALFALGRRRIMTVFYLLFVWLFVFFTGASASVVRAAVMFSILLLGMFTYRQKDGLTSLAIAMLAMTLLNPAMLFDVGFQLSCAATLGIALYYEPLLARMYPLPLFIRRSVAMTLSSLVCVLPISALTFGAFSTVGLLANLFAVPLLPMVLTGGVLGGLGIPYLSKWLFLLLRFPLRFINWLAHSLGNLPMANAPLPGITPPLIAVYALVCIALYCLLWKKIRTAVCVFNAALLLLAVVFCSTALGRGAGTATFIAVGNGDCALVRLPQHTMLVDSGGSATYDVAENTVIPYLRHIGVRKIDTVLITHYHADHCFAAHTLLQEGYVRRLILPATPQNDAKIALISTAHACDVPVLFVCDNDLLRLNETTTIAAFDTATGAEENNGIVYRLDVDEASSLFTGDITKAAEERLLARGVRVDCDLLKVAHHGSKTSSNPRFIAVASPAAAMITCRSGDRAHPSQEVLRTLSDIPTYRSDQNGTVTFKFSKTGIKQVKIQRQNAA